MKQTILYHHLGLGDHFVCNGLVHKVSESYDTIYLPCKSHNYETVEYLYSESPKIKVFKVDANEYGEVDMFSTIMHLPILLIGFHHHNPLNWDKSFYDQIGLDFSERYNSFSLPKKYPDNLIEPLDKDYILVHDQASIGKLNLNLETDLEIVRIEKGISNNLFSYIEVIRKAKEIHCINSSVFHLIDSLSCITDKLYYHDVRPSDGSNFKVSDKWKIIK